MGLFDFLKIIVSDPSKKRTAAARAKPRSASCVEVDHKSFPLAALTARGFVATGFDGSLIKGQNARLVVKVDDEVGRFSFPATVTIAEVQGDKLVGEFQLLTPELEQTLRTYAQRQKRKPAAK
ncbi:hypothetical protein [Azospirillum halopraeferens]|uniref:hypothetical protein n=1 Tax=Azospirillum halopraeferens TaxID=34010 RepID=UPI00048C6F9A|nr:hypothetical protein [Azospirillum halopraeferens]